MTSYKLVTGENPEPYNPEKHKLSGLTGLLASDWEGIVTTEAPSQDEWECVDYIRNATVRSLECLAKRDDFDKEKIRVVPFTEEQLLKFGFPGKNKFAEALSDNNVEYSVRYGNCAHYLVFRRKKVVEEERRKQQDEFFEKYWL